MIQKKEKRAALCRWNVLFPSLQIYFTWLMFIIAWRKSLFSTLWCDIYSPCSYFNKFSYWNYDMIWYDMLLRFGKFWIYGLWNAFYNNYHILRCKSRQFQRLNFHFRVMSGRNLNNVLFSTLQNPSPICVGCHSQPSERPADWDRGRFQPVLWVGCLPAVLTCAARKGGWIMEECGQEGVFFISRTSVFMGLLQSPQQDTPPQRFAPLSLQKQWRLFRIKNQNAVKLTTWMRGKNAVVIAQSAFFSSC